MTEVSQYFKDNSEMKSTEKSIYHVEGDTLKERKHCVSGNVVNPPHISLVCNQIQNDSEWPIMVLQLTYFIIFLTFLLLVHKKFIQNHSQSPHPNRQLHFLL